MLSSLGGSSLWCTIWTHSIAGEVPFHPLLPGFPSAELSPSPCQSHAFWEEIPGDPGYPLLIGSPPADGGIQRLALMALSAFVPCCFPSSSE